MSLFIVGALAGLGVAMPLGAIGVLLIREGVVAGFRVAAAGAVAVGLVDTAYCVLAVTIGSIAAPWIDFLGPAPQVVAGLVLIGLGVSGLVRSGITTTVPGRSDVTRSAVGVFARFAALTAINPATLLYFVALTAALNSADAGRNPTAFVVGVGVASVLWQLGLAAIGAVVGGRLHPAGQRLLSGAGSVIVLALGVVALGLAAISVGSS